jgi:2-polyprenyl-6-methoxyphenol hydroxylase-like FAD-dependent oxidoreductase
LTARSAIGSRESKGTAAGLEAFRCRSPLSCLERNGASPMPRTSVLIAGAGPTGLALACDLRRRRIDAEVVEKLERPVVTTRALGIQPRGRQILDRLGALRDLDQIAERNQTVGILVDGKLSAHIDMGSWRGPEKDSPLRAPQTAIEERLRERLRELGAEVRWGSAVSDIRQTPDGVEVILCGKSGRFMPIGWSGATAPIARAAN